MLSYKNRVSLYALLDAYQLTFNDNAILFGLLRNLDWYEPQSDEPISKEEIEEFISHTQSLLLILKNIEIQKRIQVYTLVRLAPNLVTRKMVGILDGWGEDTRLDARLEYQLVFAKVVHWETNRDKARQYMLANEYAQQKDTQGFLKLSAHGDGSTSKITLWIAANPWATRGIDEAAKYLMENYKPKLKPEIICLCLCHIGNIERDKLRIGKLLYKPQRKDSRNQKSDHAIENSTALRNFKKLYDSATKRYNLIFKD